MEQEKIEIHSALSDIHVALVAIIALHENIADALNKLSENIDLIADSLLRIQSLTGVKLEEKLIESSNPDDPIALAPEEKAIPEFAEKLERCVQDVKTTKHAVNPYAVCRASLRRKYGLPIKSEKQ